MKKFYLTFCLLYATVFGFSNDTLKVLNYIDFITQVMENHPYAKSASIVKSIGQSNITMARGGFDPKITGDLNQKYFDNQQYYSHLNGALKIPTWFGVTAETGYVLNEGTLLNPELKVPTNGLWYAGLKIELGKGLLIDQRRAELKKAKNYRSSTTLERNIMLNKLKRDASVAYWKWQQAYLELQVYRLAFENSSQRLAAIKQSVNFGDRPTIDTLEASIKVQNWNLSLMKVENYYNNAQLNLEMYLWSKGLIPLEINNAIPENTSINETIFQESTLDSLITNHPVLKINSIEAEQKRIDLGLKKEALKPKLTLKYNALSKPINDNPLASYAIENYNWGVKFSYPILSRKERGGVQMAKLKLKDQELKNELKAAQLKYKVNSSLNNYYTTLSQLTISNSLASGSEKLYEAEKTLFGLGESSVFLINSRENSWLKSRIELIRLKNECNSLRSELIYQLMIND
jgi:outer membrane protein TolC